MIVIGTLEAVSYKKRSIKVEGVWFRVNGNVDLKTLEKNKRYRFVFEKSKIVGAEEFKLEENAEREKKESATNVKIDISFSDILDLVKKVKEIEEKYLEMKNAVNIINKRLDKISEKE